MLSLRVFVVLVLTHTFALAQGPGGGPPPMRKHTATEAQPLKLVPADQRPPKRNKENTSERGDVRTIESNGIPEHRVGKFPNRGNPHEIEEQPYRFEIPADPKATAEIAPVHLGDRQGASTRSVQVSVTLREDLPGVAPTGHFAAN